MFPLFCTAAPKRAPSQPRQPARLQLRAELVEGLHGHRALGDHHRLGPLRGQHPYGQGVSPARTSWERGGANVRVTVSEVPGYSDTRAG